MLKTSVIDSSGGGGGERICWRGGKRKEILKEGILVDSRLHVLKHPQFRNSSERKGKLSIAKNWEDKNKGGKKELIGKGNPNPIHETTCSREGNQANHHKTSRRKVQGY